MTNPPPILTLIPFLFILMKIFYHLDCLGSRCGTHIETLVRRLYPQQSNRYHTHLLLPEYAAIFCFFNKEFMKLPPSCGLSHFDSAHVVKWVDESVRVPWHRLWYLIFQEWIWGHPVDVLQKILPRFLQIHIYRIQPKADIQWLPQFTQKLVPFFFV